MGDEFGPQPLEEVMRRFALASADLVNASKEQLSFKMVQKGRKGRRLTPNVQKKILTALRSAIAAAEKEKAGMAGPQAAPALTLKDLFNYV
jgi:hypothetical protein